MSASRVEAAETVARDDAAPYGAHWAWLAFIVALGPVWPDWLAHGLREPWAHASLLFALLFAWMGVRSPAEPARAPRLGALLVALAAFWALAFVGAAVPRFARLALPVGALGLALRYGRPRLAVAALSLWAVPLPSFVLGAASPGLESALLRIGQIFAPGEPQIGFALEAVDGGLGLAWITAGLGYYVALRLGRPPPARLRAAALGALIAFPLQIVAFVVALAVAAGDVADPNPAAVLREGPWMLAALSGVLGAELRRRLRRAGPPAR